MVADELCISTANHHDDALMLFAPVCGSVFESPMSFPPYNPYASNYSSPPTPQGFNWDEHAPGSVSTTVSTPQDIQAISPLVFQHHLSPIDSNVNTAATTPQEPAPPPPPAYEPPRTIHIQERAVPSQFRFDNIDESHFRNAEKRKASSSVDVDEMRSSTSPSLSGAGPSRVPHGRAHAQSHPYRRPRPVAVQGGVESEAQQAVVNSASSLPSRRTPARGSEPLAHERGSQLRMGTGVTPIVAPAVGSGKAVSCPAMSVWKTQTDASSESRDLQGQGVGGGGGGLSGVTNRYADPSVLSVVRGESSCRAIFPSSTRSVAVPDPTSPADTLAIQATQLPTAHTQGPPAFAKRYSIRADVHFDAASNQMTVMLELPGLKKSDIRIVMNVCPYSRVRQLTISGRSRSPLPAGTFTVQERKFGDFSRVVPVPSDTKVCTVVSVVSRRGMTFVAGGGCYRVHGRRYFGPQSPCRHSCSQRRTASHHRQLEQFARFNVNIRTFINMLSNAPLHVLFALQAGVL